MTFVSKMVIQHYAIRDLLGIYTVHLYALLIMHSRFVSINLANLCPRRNEYDSKSYVGSRAMLTFFEGFPIIFDEMIFSIIKKDIKFSL